MVIIGFFWVFFSVHVSLPRVGRPTPVLTNEPPPAGTRSTKIRDAKFLPPVQSGDVSPPAQMLPRSSSARIGSPLRSDGLCTVPPGIARAVERCSSLNERPASLDRKKPLVMSPLLLAE